MKNICFFGHVDSGKSSCAGHLYALCGGISEHELEKLKKECEEEKKMNQLWSNVLDINEEERVKGKTHEFNILPFKHNDHEYNIIDLPGHKMFIREMISGISYFESSDVIGCLLISAAKGEFEAGWIRGQTKEDMIIARSLDIQNLIVLINKLDLQDWNQDIYNNIIKEINPFIKDACGFKNVHYIPISAYKGIGLINNTNMPEWYKGKSLIDTIEEIKLDIKNEIKSFDVNEFSSLYAEIKILWCQNIISDGFECIIHYCGDEYEVIIEKINGHKILKRKDKEKCIITSKRKIRAKYASNRFIIRDSKNTIGFGTIIKVK